MKLRPRYTLNKTAKVGDKIVCPSCGTEFIKTQHQQAFCKSFGGTVCKDKYWNTITPEKRCNTTRISPANRAWQSRWEDKKSDDSLTYDEVQAKFNAAKERLRKQGYEPVSPLDNSCTSTDWAEQMMACLPMLMSCTGIYLLNNWEQSEGAKIERTFAVKKGMYTIEELK